MDVALDAHAKAPTEIRTVYKAFHKARSNSLHSNPDLVQIDDSTTTYRDGKLRRCLDLPIEIRQAFSSFLCNSHGMQQDSPKALYEVPDVPGKTDRVHQISHRLNI